MSRRVLTYASVWDTYRCDAGARLAPIKGIVIEDAQETLDGNDRVVFTVPLSAACVPFLVARRVVLFEFEDGAWLERRIQTIESEDDTGGTVRVTTVSALLDLADAGPVTETRTSGYVDLDVGLKQVTITEVIDTYLLPHLAAKGYGYFTRGTIDPTAFYDVNWSWGTPLEILRQLANAARDTTTKLPAEIRVVANGTTSYQIDVLAQIGSTTPVRELRLKKNLRKVARTLDAQNMATVVLPKGKADANGIAATIAHAVWRLDNPSGLTYEITDPEGGPSPVLEDDQLTGMCVLVAGGGLVSITASAAPSGGSPATVTLATSYGITAGDVYELRADTSGTFLTELTSPSLVKLYGRKVQIIDRPTIPGDRNLLLNPFFRTWTAGVPDHFTIASGGTVAQETNPLFTQYGGSSLHLTVGLSQNIVVRSAVVVPIPVSGAQFYSLKLHVLFASMLFGAQCTVRLVTAGGGSTAAPGVMLVGPTYPTPGGATVVAFDQWIDVSILNIDLGKLPFYTVGVQAEVQFSGVSGSGECYIDAVELVQSPSPPDTYIEFSAANALWHEANLKLALGGSPLDAYEIDADDRFAADEAAFPFEEMVIGATHRVFAPNLSIQGVPLRLLAKTGMDFADPKKVKLTVASRAQQLQDVLQNGAGSSSVISIGGGTGGGSGTPGTPGPPGTPGTPGGGGGGGLQKAAWSKAGFAGAAGTEVTIDAVPSTVTEIDARIRFFADLSPFKVVWTDGVVVSGGPSGAWKAAQYFRTSDSTWRFLDGSAGPRFVIDATGTIYSSAVVPEADAVKGLIEIRWVLGGGDDVSPVTLGNFHLNGDAITPQIGGVLPPPPPTIISPPLGNLILWLQSDRGVTTTGGTPNYVSAWADQSPSGTDATQATGGKQPRYDLLSSGLMNDQPYLHFDGTDDELEIDLSNITTAPEFTIYVVCARDIGLQQYYLGSTFGGPPALNGLRFGWYGDTEVGLDQGFFSVSATGIPDFASTSGRITCLAARSGGGVHLGGDGREIFSMGDVLVNVASALPGGGGAPPLGRIGRALSFFLKGPIWLVLAYDKAHSRAEAAIVEAYISTIYGPDVVPVDS